jgi:hypothetical protein
MIGISSKHLFCSRCWGGDTGATHFVLKILLNKDSCRKKLVFLCLILELKLIGLETVHIVIADVKTEQVEMKAAGNIAAIFLVSLL